MHGSSGNSAVVYGGVSNSSGLLLVNNSTLTDISASSGSGILSSDEGNAMLINMTVDFSNATVGGSA